MATIRERGPFQFQVIVRKKGFPQASATKASYAEAEEWGRETERKMIAGIFVDQTPLEKAGMKDILNRYRNEVTPFKQRKGRERTERGIDSEKRLIGRLIVEFGAYTLYTLQTPHIVAFRDKMMRLSRAPSTINHHVNTLSVVISHAIREWGYPLERNPCDNVTRRSARTARRRRLYKLVETADGPMSEEAWLLKHCTPKAMGKGSGLTGIRNAWLKPVVIFAIETAMRQSEITGLRWGHIDLDRRVAHLPYTKNYKARDVPLSPRAIELLLSVKPEQPKPTEKVFKTTSGAITQCFPTACKNAGIKELHFHDLRREACSRMAKLFEAQELAKITGHETLNQVLVYYEPDVEEFADRLAAAYAVKSSPDAVAVLP